MGISVSTIITALDYCLSDDELDINTTKYRHNRDSYERKIENCEYDDNEWMESSNGWGFIPIDV